MSSISSSSRTIGINIGSGTKLKDNIIPEISWQVIVNITTNPKIEHTSWNETVNNVKYSIVFFSEVLIYAVLTEKIIPNKRVTLNKNYYIFILYDKLSTYR
jgi:hypothetical protein